MRLTLMPEALRPEVSRCAKVAAKDKSAGPQIELTASSGVVHLRAQDSHVHIVAAVAADVKEPGSVLIDCDRLVAVLGVRPDGTLLQVWSEGSNFHIKQGEFRVKIPLLKSSILPVSFDGPFDLDITVPKKMLHGMLRCRASVEDEEALFPGMLLDFSEAGVLRVAAFTRALHQVAHFDMPQLPAYRVVLSPQCLPILAAMPEEGFRLAFSVSQARAFMIAPTFAVCTVCLVDRFPAQYQAVIGLHRWKECIYPVPFLKSDGTIVSERNRITLVLSTKETLAALQSATVVLDKSQPTVEMRIGQRLDDGHVVVEFVGNNPSTKANATEKVLAFGDVPSAVAFGLHYVSVRSMLKHFDSEEFVMHIGRSNDSVAFTEKGYEHIVAFAVPMRLTHEA